MEAKSIVWQSGEADAGSHVLRPFAKQIAHCEKIEITTTAISVTEVTRPQMPPAATNSWRGMDSPNEQGELEWRST
jgi:hypothetical protein